MLLTEHGPRQWPTLRRVILPTPSDTPYQTPSRGLSGRSSRQASASPYPITLLRHSHLKSIHTARQRMLAVKDTGSGVLEEILKNRICPSSLKYPPWRKSLRVKKPLCRLWKDHYTRHDPKMSDWQRLRPLRKQKWNPSKSRCSHSNIICHKNLEKIVRERDNAIDSIKDTWQRLESQRRKFAHRKMMPIEVILSGERHIEIGRQSSQSRG